MNNKRGQQAALRKTSDFRFQTSDTVENKRGQQGVVGFGVTCESRLAAQNCFAILDGKDFENEFQKFRFNLACLTGGLYDKR